MRFSEAEWKVMRAVWRRPGCSVRDVVDDLAGEIDWSYSTVKTMLARLVEKGALSLQRDGNLHRYSATVAERDARRSALRSLLDRAFDGTLASLVHHMVVEEKLSDRDVAELRHLLDAEPDSEGRPRRKAKR